MIFSNTYIILIGFFKGVKGQTAKWDLVQNGLNLFFVIISLPKAGDGYE